jgi:hypothetical protein
MRQSPHDSSKGKAPRKLARGRPKLPRVSEEMKRLAELLEAEVRAWPNVTSRPMFGLTGLYNGQNIFAVLPRTRAMDTPDSIGFRLLKRPKHIVTQLHEDERIVAATPAAKWILFVLQSDADIHGALNWLALAYREAHK